ncbi:septal ring lytic transglycosylase RlpA family protein [Holophaga foetida]|uniref:septal ring lytic transglycosylase RlpA family protein n=1 Tax=Holophaga foetida TaxID=35839 RepID=UPI000247534E|nr:septal ring lytic transglycosylase RlpA family protein [Holophaga foetida]
MDLQTFVGENVSRAFSIWIEGIQVQFLPAAERRAHTGGFLARVRSITRLAAPVVIPFFCLHCARPQVSLAQRERQIVERAPSLPKPAPEFIYTESGVASWYGGQGDGFGGQRTASGEALDPAGLTCAHRTLPFDTLIEVENLDSGKRAILRVNDRGPFIRGRVLDVSLQAARELGFLAYGTARVLFREVRETSFEASLDSVEPDALVMPSNLGLLQKALELVFGPSAYQQAQSSNGRDVKRLRAGAFLSPVEAGKMPDEPISPLPHVDPFIFRRS